MRRKRLRPAGVVCVTATLAVMLAGCAGTPVSTTVYRAPDGEDLIHRFAPIFVVEDAEEPHNAIGTPIVRTDNDAPYVDIDPSVATMYARRESFRTKRGRYTNLIYRVHFERTPWNRLTWGENVGLMIFVTLNENENPILITTVHTCGCYLAFAPTNFLPAEARPEGWDPLCQDVYGERLPGLLVFQKEGNSPDRLRPVVFKGRDTHRVTHLTTLGAKALDLDQPRTLHVVDVGGLDRLPTDTGKQSFFHEKGTKRGYVKGSTKPWEMLFMGWWAMDWRVGRDKRYAPPERMATRFYTSLKFWRREESDLWDFGRCLEYYGWNL